MSGCSDLYNRQLHPDEAKKLADLQKGKSADEQHKLAAAECALTQCATGVPDNDPDKAALTKLQNEGQSYTYEQGLLKNAGAFDGYGWADSIVDFNDRNHLTTRAGGAVQGVTGAAVAATVAGAGCSTGVACALALTGAATSLDWSLAGFKTAVNGDPTSTYGEQVLQGLGVSPTGAALTYGLVNIGAAGGAALADGAGSAGSPSASGGSRVVDVPVPVTSGGRANAATGPGLSADLAIAQSKDPLIGTTLPGAAAPVQVTADASIGGKSFFDVNQTARGTGFGEANQPTLISDLVAPGDPNGSYGAAHAEIGVIQQAYNAGLTKGQSMTVVVRGQSPCSYCSSDLMDMANAAGLNQLTVVDGATGAVRQWIRGATTWNTIKPPQSPN